MVKLKWIVLVFYIIGVFLSGVFVHEAIHLYQYKEYDPYIVFFDGYFAHIDYDTILYEDVDVVQEKETIAMLGGWIIWLVGLIGLAANKDSFFY